MTSYSPRVHRPPKRNHSTIAKEVIKVPMVVYPKIRVTVSVEVEYYRKTGTPGWSCRSTEVSLPETGVVWDPSHTSVGGSIPHETDLIAENVQRVAERVISSAAEATTLTPFGR